MRYKVRVGVIAENATEVGARGYAVAVHGRTVVVHYGKIEVTGSGTSKFHWKRTPKPYPYPCSTPKAARAKARELVRKQLQQNSKGSYQLLPKDVRIRQPIQAEQD